MTHRSAGRDNNERLEFLGDAVLGMVMAAALFQARSTATEGTLTRWRAMLVKKQTLAEIAVELDLGDSLVLGSGEMKSGGRRRESILSDTLEALLGAIYLDSGLDEVTGVIQRIYGERLSNLPDADQLKDPKTRLQEHLQSRGRDLPKYTVIGTQGKAHEQQITVRCQLIDFQIVTEATASSRRKAEQATAERALQQLEQSDNG